MDRKRKIYFVTATDTASGKTVVSSIVAKALGADYWKPIQSGGLDYTDTDVVRALTTPHEGVFHREDFRFYTPASPHYAAEVEGKEIALSDFVMPDTDNHLVIEGAGGLMVPLNRRGDMMTDLIRMLEAQAILVSNYYVGSINHTLLSYEVLKRRNIPVAGIVFNRKENPGTESVILQHTNLKKLLHVREEEQFTKEIIASYADEIRPLV